MGRNVAFPHHEVISLDSLAMERQRQNGGAVPRIELDSISKLANQWFKDGTIVV